MKPRAVVFDIDGTLADLKHRLPLLPNYNAFFDEMHKDTCIESVAELARIIYDTGVYQVILSSGRPDSHREETLRWLADNAIPHHRLYMRKTGDYRPDHVIKNEVREKIQEDYHILLVIDDRPKVVEMWRSHGLKVLQPEYNEKPKYKSGRLIVMVGPSCAGKSHLAREFRQDLVVSSDKIREDLCGDFRDQSKNEQVFDAFHDIISSRLRNGLTTVADATHIKRKARLETLACAPADCEIDYYIVNRPMKDKIRQAGWRDGVMVKGKPLIAYHEEVFQSNFSDIWHGDGDPRVRIRNYMV